MGAKKRKLRSLELFTGAGGLALATHEAGMKHAALLEWNRDACDTLRSNIEARSIPGISTWSVREGDVREVQFSSEFSEIDVVAGGPPCQPFSIGGKHRGMSDGRDMIPHFIRAVRDLAPRAFIMENVKGLTRQSFRNYLQYTLLQLSNPSIKARHGEEWDEHLSRLEDVHTKGKNAELHYNVVYRVLNAADFGVPQTRERIFVVGFRADLGIEWHFPEPTHSLDTLLHDQFVSGSYWERHGTRNPYGAPPRSYAARVRRLHEQPRPKREAWTTVRDAIHDLPAPRRRGSDGTRSHVFQDGARTYVGHTGSLIDLPSKTLKAGDHGVPGGENMIRFPDDSVRYFTIREAARMQTFPEEWRFSGAWSETMRQLGNAVPAQLATSVAKSVADALKG